MFLVQSLAQIIAAGGSISIDASKYIAPNLIQLATVAAQSEAKYLILKNSSALLPITCIQIAQAGRGKVIFDIDV